MAAAVAIAPISAERSLRPVVLVTGGSRGIGLALAHGFAARGYDVVLVARDAERLQRTASAIATAHGVSADHIACDLAEPHAVADLMTAVADAGCCVDILVNCAGVGTSGAFTGNDDGGDTRRAAPQYGRGDGPHARLPARHGGAWTRRRAQRRLARRHAADAVPRALRCHQVLPRRREPGGGKRAGRHRRDGVGAAAGPRRHGVLRPQHAIR